MASVLNFFRRQLTAYRNLGVEPGMADFEKRSHYIFNFMLALTLAITVVYATIPYFVLNITHVGLNHVINGSLFIGYAFCVALVYFRKPLASRLIFTTLVQGHIFVFTLLLGWQIGNYLFYLALPALPYVLFHKSRFGIAYAFLTGVLGFGASFAVKKYNLQFVAVTPAMYDGLFLIAFASSFSVVFMVVRLFFKLSRETEIRLQHEKRRSERLLLNILPAEIAERLQNGENTIADHYPKVYVLFADIVGFTQLSSQTTPDEVVRRLNEVFSLIDILVEKYDVEKIKTIGDAYMVVAGIPKSRHDDAGRILGFAKEMLEMVKTMNALELRIGIDVGEATAGVIGTKKFIFDLWGDTVNTASRMESHGEPGKIHVTERVVAGLGGEFAIEERGKIIIKGKGEMKTFFVG